MSDLARLLILAGGALLLGGLLLLLLSRAGISRLPGDFVIRRGNFTLYVPLLTSLLLSVLVTFLLWVFRR